MDADRMSVPSSIGDSDATSFTTTTNETLSRCSSMDPLPPGYVEEKFKVDRRKLEAMIIGYLPDPWDTQIKKIPIASDGRIMSADDFFQMIMKLTNTEIKYPKFLKIGGRNKKDPYIRVIGTEDAVRCAAQRVLYDMEPSNKITMKLDVSWTCHSHIIGKAGNTIQPVVRKTGVSIHFPDGNKNSEVHKSNQVSINCRGQELSGLEEARSAIRELTPLIFSFFLPGSAQFLIPTIDHSLLVIQVQNTYNVQADIQISNEGSPVIIGSVKGTEWDSSRVKEATLVMLQNLCGNLAYQMPVQVTLDISPQHHSFILGKNSENLKRIMQQTSTRIIFPDNNDPLLPPLKRYRVVISGAIDNVYLARQNLIGSLPLVIMFDLMQDQTLSQRELDQIMQAMEVQITTRTRRASSRQTVTLRAAERNASNLYDAWKLISNDDKPIPKAKVPRSYFIDEMAPLYDLGLLTLDMNLSEKVAQTCLNNNNKLQINLNQVDNVAVDSLASIPLSRTLSDITDTGSVTQSQRDVFSSSSLTGQLQLSSSFSSSKNSDAVELKDFQNILDMIPDRRAPGWEKKQRDDYFSRKLLATRVMKQPVTPAPRTPTSDWSGYGFSKTLPGFAIHQLWKDDDMLDRMRDRDNLDLYDYSSPSLSSSCDSMSEAKKMFYGLEDCLTKPQPNIAASNYLETVMARSILHLPKSATDLNTLLANIHLEQYCDLFSFHGIDLIAFSHLNDQDLKDLGVALFGHRKRLLMAIKELQSDRLGSLFE